MICKKCKKESTVNILTAKGAACPTCNMHLNPPVMVLILTRAQQRLYNQTNKIMETAMTIKQFQNCGWFIRRREEEGCLATYTLEYHGKVRCARCEGYRWPFDLTESCKAYGMCLYRKGRLGDGTQSNASVS